MISEILMYAIYGFLLGFFTAIILCYSVFKKWIEDYIKEQIGGSSDESFNEIAENIDEDELNLEEVEKDESI